MGVNLTEKEFRNFASKYGIPYERYFQNQDALTENRPKSGTWRNKRRRQEGFTNRLATKLVQLLFFVLLGGFILGILSIVTGYSGPLVCYTATFAPIGTACSLVLGAIVNKSRAENIGPNGTGIKYAAAAATGFNENIEFVPDDVRPTSVCEQCKDDTESKPDSE